MPENNQMMSVEGQLVGMPLAGPESFSQQQLDYLKRALGVDETVLWEATANNQYSATLSEPYSNFERIRIEFNSNDALNTGKSLYNEFPGYVTQFNLIGQRTDGGGIVMTLSDLNGSEDKTRLTPSYGRYVIVSKTSTTLNVGSINIALKSIVGIHRIAGGNQ